MEKYREKLRLSIITNSIAAAALLAVQVLGFTRVIRPVAADAHWADMWNGFIAGAALGIMALFIVGIILSVGALRDEKKLKKLYIKETDERSNRIWTESRSAGAQLFMIAGLAAGIVAGYFSVAVSIAIIACAVANAVMCVSFKVWYGRKY